MYASHLVQQMHCTPRMPPWMEILGPGRSGLSAFDRRRTAHVERRATSRRSKYSLCLAMGPLSVRRHGSAPPASTHACSPSGVAGVNWNRIERQKRTKARKYSSNGETGRTPWIMTTKTIEIENPTSQPSAHRVLLLPTHALPELHGPSDVRTRQSSSDTTRAHTHTSP